MNMENEAVHWQAKKHPKLLAARRHGIDFLFRASKRNQPCQHLDFGFLAPRTVRE